MKNIILATDDRYAVPCMVTISSLLCNNDPKDCTIHIMTEGFSDNNLELLEQLRSRFPKASINLKIINREQLKGVILTDRFPISNFFRLLVPSLFDFAKALYIDCDTIITNSIDELWNIDLNNYACGIVEDQACEDITLHNRIYQYTPYYNAGVLLMNLDFWRKHNISYEIIKFMRDYPERCLYPDQDAINSVLVGKLISMPYRFNVQERWYEPQQHWLMHRDKWQEIEEAKKNPVIIHYTGPQKPWMAGCSHPLAHLYFKYKKNVIDESLTEEEDRIRTQQKQALEKEKIERKRRHKHIRRANLFTILFVIETIIFLAYLLFS